MPWSLLSLILLVSSALLALIGAVALLDARIRRRRYLPEPDQIHYAATPDGWRLALSRYLPTEGAPARRHPVILAPGIGVNGGFFDAPTNSLPRWLAARGFDTWLLEVRGVGFSRRHKPKIPSDWDFDTLALQDVPTAIATVLAATGASQLHWVGHSLGGMILAPTLGSQARDQLVSATIMGSAFVFGPKDQPLLTRAAYVGRSRLLPRLPVRLPSRLHAPIARFVTPWPARWLFNPHNMTPTARVDMMISVTEQIAPGLLRQLSHCILNGQLSDRTGQRAWTEHLQDSPVPLLVIAGAKDHVAPPSGVKATAALFDPAHTTYRELGVATGFRHDYGHGDLSLGQEAPAEVFPVILEGLIAND